MASIDTWPEESQEAVKQVIKTYGEPDEATDSLLIWHNPGPWKRIVAYKNFFAHNFPAPHIDCIESVIDHKVPVEKMNEIATFDGSITVRRTAGELSATCHDEQANFLALNLVHDIITGTRSVSGARDYYAKEFLNARKKEATPYMQELIFTPDGNGDPDERIISQSELNDAVKKGESKT